MTSSETLRLRVQIHGSRLSAALKDHRTVNLISDQPILNEIVNGYLASYLEALSRYRRCVEVAIEGRSLHRPPSHFNRRAIRYSARP